MDTCTETDNVHTNMDPFILKKNKKVSSTTQTILKGKKTLETNIWHYEMGFNCLHEHRLSKLATLN